MDLSKFKYYIPFETRYKDLSSTYWQKYDQEGVVTAQKSRLINLHSIKSDALYNSADSSDYYYHPVLIAQCSLGCFNLIADGFIETYMPTFEANINWLIRNGVEYKNTIVFPFPYGIPDFNPEPGWVSGMYQGQILSALLRSYLITQDIELEQICSKIYNSFSLCLGELYGFRMETDDALWFEEAPQFPPRHILNGAIYAIWGIFDYMVLFPGQEVARTWEKSVQTIKKNLPKYDSGFWSYYDLNKSIASYYYHNSVHVPQLKVLHEQTGDLFFLNYSIKWETYGKKLQCRLMKKLFSAFQVLNSKLISIINIFQNGG